MSYPAFVSRMVVVRSTTPRLPATMAVRSLCERLTSGGEFSLLPFSAVNPRYKAGFCHANVLHRTRTHGGSREFGWLVWEHPGLLAEGEFHSVWRSPTGELVDLTPRADGERLVMFVVDRERRLERSGTFDMTWANYSIRGGHPEPVERYIISRDHRFVKQMERLGFSRDQSLS